MKSNYPALSSLVVGIDNPDILILQPILQSLNIGLHRVANSNEALISIRDFQPNFIIINNQLTDSKATDFCHLLKKNISTASIPVFIIFDTDKDTDRTNIYRAGATDYLQKPFIAQEIANRLNTQLKTGELNKLRNSLKLSEEKFKKAFSTSPDCVNMNNLADGTYVSLNKGFIQTFGYTEAETIGKTSIEMNIWHDLNDRVRWSEILKKNGEVKSFETKFRIKSGQIINAVVSASIIDFNGVPHVLSITRDITERKKMEEAIINQAERLNNMHQADVEILKGKKSVKAIIEKIMTDTAKLLGFDQAVAEQFNTESNTKEILVYINIKKTKDKSSIQTLPDSSEILTDNKMIVIEDTSRYFDQQVKKHIPNDEDIQSLVLNTLISGEKKIGTIGLYWSSKKKFSGTELDIIGEIADQITLVIEQNRLRRETQKYALELEHLVQKRTEQLEEANKELEAFSYSVSHDLRAPLRHINGYVDILINKFDDNLPDKAKHYLSTIANSSKQMGDLIDDLLQFSRTGRQDLLQSKIDMNIMVNEIVHAFKNETSHRKIRWQIDTLPLIHGDANMLKLVWQNLISNAVKFTKYKEEAIIKIGCKTNENEHIFYVSDNGSGFDMQYAHKLFGVFQRLHYADEFEGTGIGLANVRRIILKHGGRTWAEAELNKGATFYFTITTK